MKPTASFRKTLQQSQSPSIQMLMNQRLKDLFELLKEGERSQLEKPPGRIRQALGAPAVGLMSSGIRVQDLLNSCLTNVKHPCGGWKGWGAREVWVSAALRRGVDDPSGERGEE